VCSVSALKLEALSTHLNWGLVSSSPAWSGKFAWQLSPWCLLLVTCLSQLCVFFPERAELEALSTHLNWGLVSSSPASAGKSMFYAWFPWL
jgi:hypothetical protein